MSAVLTLCAVLLGAPIASAQTFPPQGDDTTPSMGVFRVTVDPAFRPLVDQVGALVPYAGYNPANGRLTSPLCVDNATTIGRSGPNSRFYAFPVSVGAGSWDSIAGYASYPLIPLLWAAAPAPTEEVLTEIKSFVLLSAGGSAGQHCPPDPRIPDVPPGWAMVKAGTFAGVSPRSLGMVQENVVNGPPAPDFPAHSFFDIFVEVNLPPIPGTESGVAFPAGGAILYNDTPLVITNLNLTSFPPVVIYIHGETPAVPLKFKVNNPPYWNAGDLFGYLVLAGHGTITNDCTSPNGQGPLLDAVLGPIGTSKPELPIEWPRTNTLCPSPGSTYDSVKGTNSDGTSIDVVKFPIPGGPTIRTRNFSHSNLTNPITPPLLNGTATYSNANTLVTFDFSFDGLNWNPSQAAGPAAVRIHHTSDAGGTSTFDTEMLQLDLAGGTVLIRESPTLQSLGKHTIRPDGSLFRIGSFFDVFLELSTDGGASWIPADRAIRVQPSSPPPPPIVLNCTNISVTATSAAGATVTYTISTSGGCPPVTVNCNPPSGSTFPIGTNTVICAATDACGQGADCSFTITVKPGDPCLEPDNGSGTVTLLPQGCQYLSPDQVQMIINGLALDTTSKLAAIHKDIICGPPPHPCPNDCYVTDNCDPSTSGATEGFSSTLQLHLVGTGQLKDWVRDLTIPNVQCQSHVGPHILGSPVQSFDTEMLQIQGQLPPGDPDFDLLRITAGSGFGLPSPGHTTLTRQGPAGSDWAVDSFFDITYRIDYVGHPGGHVGGMSGSTTGTIRMTSVRPPTPVALNCSSNLTVATTSATGAVVTFASSASGGCSPPPTVVCNPPSGSTFPVGLTTVTCTAGDICGQAAECSFTVTVVKLNLDAQPVGSQMRVTWSTGTLQQADKVNGPYIDIDPQPASPWTFTPTGARRFFRVRAGQPGFTFYDTELLQLDISGGTLPAGMRVRESPTLASTGKTAISPPPGGGFIIDSVFDVFTELTMNVGQTWLVSTSAPPRMRFTGNAPSSDLPPKDANYVSPADWHAAYDQGIYITNASHLGFTTGFPPPAPGGVTDVHSFGSTVNMMVRPCAACPFQAVTANAQVTVQIRSRP